MAHRGSLVCVQAVVETAGGLQLSARTHVCVRACALGNRLTAQRGCLVDVRECNCVAIFMWPEEEMNKARALTAAHNRRLGRAIRRLIKWRRLG